LDVEAAERRLLAARARLVGARETLTQARLAYFGTPQANGQLQAAFALAQRELDDAEAELFEARTSIGTDGGEITRLDVYGYDARAHSRR
jgi:hypothetical protein